MALPFWDVLHPDIVDKRTAAGFENPAEPPGYEEDKSIYNPWDRLWFGGELMPGIVTVKVSPVMRVDVYKEAGKDGGPSVERGYESAKVDITVKLWTPTQWEMFQFVMGRVWRAVDKAPVKVKSGALVGGNAIEIFHPACALYGINAVLLESPSAPEPAPERGAMVVNLKCLQYMPPAKRTATVQKKGAAKEVALTPELDDQKSGPPAKTESEKPVPARKRPAPTKGDT